MRKQNPVWEFTVRHQHYFNKKLSTPAWAFSAAWLAQLTSPPRGKRRFISKRSYLFEALISMGLGGLHRPKLPRMPVSSDNQFISAIAGIAVLTVKIRFRQSRLVLAQ
jgi:hypothetical protein